MYLDNSSVQNSKTIWIALNLVLYSKFICLVKFSKFISLLVTLFSAHWPLFLDLLSIFLFYIGLYLGFNIYPLLWPLSRFYYLSINILYLVCLTLPDLIIPVCLLQFSLYSDLYSGFYYLIINILFLVCLPLPDLIIFICLSQSHLCYHFLCF